MLIFPIFGKLSGNDLKIFLIMLFGKEYDYSIIRTTSKDALKRTALIVSGNDIKKAEEIYDFFIKDLPDMPDYDPVPLTTFEQVKGTAQQIIQWSQENQDQVRGAISLIMQLFGKQPAVMPTNVPPPIE